MKNILLSLALVSMTLPAMALEQNSAATFTSFNYGKHFAKGLHRTAKSNEFMASAPRRSFAKANVGIPASFSLRGKVGPVEDQGQCGSCWDFSLTEVLRGTYIAAGKDPGRLSFNYLLNCNVVTKNEGNLQYNCENGGYFDAAQYFVAPLGAPAYGSDGEYTAADGTCQNGKAIASTTSYTFLGAPYGSQTSTVSFKDIAYVVGILHQPVSIDVAATDNWSNYANGIYNGCDDDTNVNDINHMVVIEGYDCETAVDANGNCQFDANGNLPAGVGTYLIKNSWNTTWGDAGYITTKATDAQGHACNQVATDALYYQL